MIVTKKHIYIGGVVGITLLSIGVSIYVYHKSKAVNLSAFDSPDLKGSGLCMDKTLLKKLETLVLVTGFPIFDWINSGARSEYWNKKVGGVANSAHKMPNCKAVDIGVPNNVTKRILVFAAKAIGFKRIGVGKTFVHLDVDTTKSQYVAWGYPKGTPAPFNPFT